MSLLTLIQDVCNQIGLPAPTAVVGSQNLLYKQMLSVLHSDAANELKSKSRWPELTRTHTITLVDGQASYALPADLERQVTETHWDQANQWPLRGPMSPQRYNEDTYGVTDSSSHLEWRIKGFTDNQFLLSPVPTASDDGNVLSFEYQSSTWCRPATWTTATVYASGQYTFYNGNIYYNTGSGTSGATPPTHTTGNASDGSINWVFSSAPYTRFMADTDETIIPEYICVLCLKYLFSQQKGLPFQVHYQRYVDELNRQATKKRGTRTINMAGGHRRHRVVARGPEQNWGS